MSAPIQTTDIPIHVVQSAAQSLEPIHAHEPTALLLTALILALIAYAGTFRHLLYHIFNKTSPSRTLTIGVLFIGLVLHAVVLLPYLLTPYGIDFNLCNILSLTGWLILTLSVMFSSYRPVLGLNVLAIPVAAMGLLVGYFLHAPYQPLAVINHGLEGHIILSLAAYCVLFMAAFQAILLHVQNRELKHKTGRRIWVSILPPLQTMETLLFDMLLIGFILLTVALLLGLLSVNNLLTQHLAHKTFFSVLSWLVFGTLLIGRWRMGWRGHRAITFTLWGFGLLLVGFVGSKFVLEVLLGIS